MEYLVRLHKERVERRINRWGLSDYLLIEVYLALDELKRESFEHLQRDRDGRGGAFYVFDRIDPADPRFRHIFQFRVIFSVDERQLDVVYASYWRRLIA